MLFRDRFGTKMLSSDPRPKCKVLIFTATKKREKDTSNPPPATKADNSKELSASFFSAADAKVTSFFLSPLCRPGPVVSSLSPTSIGESGSLLVFGRFPGYRCITCGGCCRTLPPPSDACFPLRSALVRTVLDF